MTLDKHPIQVIELFNELPNAPQFYEFSTYSYKPKAIEDERQLFHIRRGEVKTWFENQIKTLAVDEDIAFHSRVHCKSGLIQHFPMIDFMQRPSRKDFEEVEKALREFGIGDFRLYDSGRSLHLYGIGLFSTDEWLRFSGRILLLNSPNILDLVDVRWLGHRLMAGYGTLRWTKNNAHYMGIPRAISAQDLG